MDYFRSGIKVASLFIVSCGILTYFVLHAGQVRVMGESRNYKILFSSIGNLKLDSPVTYSGFKVGQVVGIRSMTDEERKKYKRDVEVTVRIDKNALIRKDSRADILTLGFLGEKYVEISPGGFESEIIGPEDLVIGIVPQDLTTIVDHLGKEVDAMLPTIKNTLQSLESTAQKVDQVIGEIAEEKKLQKILSNAEEITSHIDEILEENRKNLHGTLENAETLTADLKQELNDASPKIEKMLDEMNRSFKDLDNLLNEARSLLKTNSPGVDRIMNNLEEASSHGKEFLRILKEQPWRLLAKPRNPPVIKEPKERGFTIYHKDIPEKSSHE